MGDDFDRVSEYWALAARLLQKQVENEEDGWSLKIHDATLLEMSFGKGDAWVSRTVLLVDHDLTAGTVHPRPEEDLLEDVRNTARELAQAARKLSTI